MFVNTWQPVGTDCHQFQSQAATLQNSILHIPFFVAITPFCFQILFKILDVFILLRRWEGEVIQMISLSRWQSGEKVNAFKIPSFLVFSIAFVFYIISIAKLRKITKPTI